MKYFLAAAVALTFVHLPRPAQAEMFSSAYAQGVCITNEGGSARIRGCVEGAANQNIVMTWIARENVFYGPLRINGYCLQDNGVGRVLTFAGCNGSKAQEWKLSGSGVLNNGLNQCADIERGARTEGTPIIAWSCTRAANQLWWNESYRRAKVLRVPGMLPVAPGTRLAISGRSLVIAGTRTVVAPDASRIIAAGGGNIIAAGAGNVIASGALN